MCAGVLDLEQRTLKPSRPAASFDHPTRPAGMPQGGRERDKSHANPAGFKAAPG